MLDPDRQRLSKLEIVGERKHDDLPCSECENIAPVVVVKCSDCGRTYDVCSVCARRLGLIW